MPCLVIFDTKPGNDRGYKDALSGRGAAVVTTWIKAKTERTIAAQGSGKRRLVAPDTQAYGSDGPDRWRQNRRIGIVIRAVTASEET